MNWLSGWGSNLMNSHPSNQTTPTITSVTVSPGIYDFPEITIDGSGFGNNPNNSETDNISFKDSRGRGFSAGDNTGNPLEISSWCDNQIVISGVFCPNCAGGALQVGQVQAGDQVSITVTNPQNNEQSNTWKGTLPDWTGQEAQLLQQNLPPPSISTPFIATASLSPYQSENGSYDLIIDIAPNTAINGQYTLFLDSSQTQGILSDIDKSLQLPENQKPQALITEENSDLVNETDVEAFDAILSSPEILSSAAELSDTGAYALGLGFYEGFANTRFKIAPPDIVTKVANGIYSSIGDSNCKELLENYRSIFKAGNNSYTPEFCAAPGMGIAVMIRGLSMNNIPSLSISPEISYTNAETDSQEYVSQGNGTPVVRVSKTAINITFTNISTSSQTISVPLADSSFSPSGATNTVKQPPIMAPPAPPQPGGQGNGSSSPSSANSGQSATVNAVIHNMGRSIELPPGRLNIYGMATGGALSSSPFVSGQYSQATDASGQVAAELAFGESNQNSFTTGCAYTVIGGVSVAGTWKSFHAVYGSNESPGASNASVSFTLPGNSLVVVVGTASSQQSISLSGLQGLQTDAINSGPSANIAMVIGHAYLPPGEYTIVEQSAALAAGQNPNHMADLVGVFIFGMPESAMNGTRNINNPSFGGAAPRSGGWTPAPAPYAWQPDMMEWIRPPWNPSGPDVIGPGVSPNGIWFIRRSFTISSTGDYNISAWADDGFIMYFDDRAIGVGSLRNLFQPRKITLTAGKHLLEAEITNNDNSSSEVICSNFGGCGNNNYTGFHFDLTGPSGEEILSTNNADGWYILTNLNQTPDWAIKAGYLRTAFVNHPIYGNGSSATIQVPAAWNSSGWWVDSGIKVSRGKSVNVAATGTWNAWVGRTSNFGPDGSTYHWYDQFLDGSGNFNGPHFGALIGFIGNVPPQIGSYRYLTKAQRQAAIAHMVVLGADATVTAPASGELWLGMNDDAYSGNSYDNTGSVSVSVQMQSTELPSPQENSCTPDITSVSVSPIYALRVHVVLPIQTNSQPIDGITIKGSCFGTFTHKLPYTGNSRYIEIADNTGNWDAGHTAKNSWATYSGGILGNDYVTLKVQSWTDNQIVISGFDGDYVGGWKLNPGDQLTISVWNPQTGTGPATKSTSVQAIVVDSYPIWNAIVNYYEQNPEAFQQLENFEKGLHNFNNTYMIPLFNDVDCNGGTIMLAPISISVPIKGVMTAAEATKEDAISFLQTLGPILAKYGLESDHFSEQIENDGYILLTYSDPNTYWKMFVNLLAEKAGLPLRCK